MAGTIGVVAAVVGAGAAVYSASRVGKTPQLPEIQQEKETQDAKGPEGQVIKRQGSIGIPAGAATMLTGSSGVNPSSLSIGKNTLLGG